MSGTPVISPELFELPLVERGSPRRPALRARITSEVFWLPVVFVILLCVFWKGLLGLNRAEQQLVEQAAQRNQDNMAQAIAERAAQIFDNVRLYGSVLVANVGQGDDAFRESVRLAVEQDRAIKRLWQFDAAGTLVFASTVAPETWLTDAARDIGSEAETTIVKRLPRPQAALVGGDSGTPNGGWRQPLLFRTEVSGAHGRDSIVAVIDLASALDTFNRNPLGNSGEITLTDRSGQILARLSDNAGETEASSRTSAPTSESGSARINAFRDLRNTPLSVHVSRAVGDVIRDKRDSDRSRVTLFVALSALAFALLLARISALLRHERLEDHLLSIQNSNTALLKEVEAERHAAYVLATHDKLTGLPNRMLFADLSQRCVGRARRTNSRFAVMFIDLDRFKPINDTYGHKVGDHLLVEVARRLLACFRDTDVVARFGGDEFVVLISDVRRRQDVAVIAKKVIASLSENFHGIVDDELRISSSIGIAFFPDDAQQVDDLVRHADAAMYEAKAKGRSTFVFADRELSRRIELNNEIEVALPFAIEHREIHVHYQPKVSLTDYSICGLEALARWTHPRMGHVSPADFIATAERSGLIIDLGGYVLREVCRQMSEWQQRGVPLVPVAVNVSWLQLQSPGFVTFLADTLAETALPPELIELEITETGLVHAEGALLDTLHELREHGFRLAIDDFGTGYSGLSKLRTLPASYLKIDKSFIKDIRNDSHDAAIVSNTISLSQSLHLVAIAEGVETAKQVAHLRAVGCDQAQGYLFSRPCAPATVEALLHERFLYPRIEESP